MLGLAGAVCLYRGRPPPLAADATEVEGPHLHLHDRDRELVAFPVVPVNTLSGRKSNHYYHILGGQDKAIIIKYDGKTKQKRNPKRGCAIFS